METQNTWIDSWLKMGFYKEKCDKHIRQYKTVLCCTCNDKLSCEMCWKESLHQHTGHRFLQVCKASKRTAIKADEIGNHYDVSEIQRYVINHREIVFLNPDKIINGKNPNKCRMCSRPLIDSISKFCSISCKIKNGRKCHLETNAEQQTLISGDQINAREEKSVVSISSRGVKREGSDNGECSTTTNHASASHPLFPSIVIPKRSRTRRVLVE